MNLDEFKTQLFLLGFTTDEYRDHIQWVNSDMLLQWNKFQVTSQKQEVYFEKIHFKAGYKRYKILSSDDTYPDFQTTIDAITTP